MKKVFFTVVLGVCLSAFSTQGHAQQRVNYYSPETMEEIKATEVQKTAVKELVAKYDVLFKDLKANKTLSETEAAAEKKRLTSERAKAYWKILTPEQSKYLRDKAKGN